jgi:signal transduction histidine kinase
MVMAAFRSLLREPRAPGAPRRVWRDWVLVGILVILSVFEISVRDDVVSPPLALVLSIGAALLLLWRRTHPLLVLAIGFGIVAIIDVVAIAAGSLPVGLYSMASLVILTYSLLRWGSGREIVIGALFIVLALVLGNAADFQDWGEAFAGSLVLFFPAALGATMRFRAVSRLKEFDQVRLHEREQFARELHDTVAHHVSAIAIQAQAGLALASSDSEAPLEALRTVETEASRTLNEMRSMVGALRAGESGELSPQRGVSEIALLADLPGALPMEVRISGNLDGLGPAMESALYRLAQESITNATRHARNATEVKVDISGDTDSVVLVVRDDGYPLSGPRSGVGYGIVGMTERANLFGGTLVAGPGAKRGWVVRAELPRKGTK